MVFGDLQNRMIPKNGITIIFPHPQITIKLALMQMVGIHRIKTIIMKIIFVPIFLKEARIVVLFLAETFKFLGKKMVNFMYFRPCIGRIMVSPAASL